MIVLWNHTDFIKDGTAHIGAAWHKSVLAVGLRFFFFLTQFSGEKIEDFLPSSLKLETVQETKHRDICSPFSVWAEK